MHVASDGGPTTWISDGTTWFPVLNGRTGHQVPPVASWTQFGSAGTATFTDQAGRIVGTTTSTADTLSGLVVAKPATCDARVHVSSVAAANGGSVGGSGIVLRNSATQNAVVWIWAKPPIIVAGAWTNDVTPSGGLDVETPGDYSWLRVVDDGTDFIFYTGDGVIWKENFRITNTVITPAVDQIGLAFGELAGPYVQYDSWELL
jgi:hypothetical protein